MGLHSVGLIIRKIFAPELGGLIFGRAHFFFEWGGGLLSEFYGI